MTAAKIVYKTLETDYENSAIIMKIKESNKNQETTTMKHPFYMEWIEKIMDKVEKEECPTCKSKLIPIVYGLPSAEDLEV